MTHLNILFMVKLGWQNTAALSYQSYPNNAATQPNTLPPALPPFRNSLQMPPLPGSNFNNQIPGVNLSYGFSPNVTPCQIPNERPSAGYPSVPPISSLSGPSIGWALQGSTDSASNAPAVNDTGIEKQVEIPCQAIIVPDEDMPIYSFGYSTVSHFGHIQ